MGYSDTTRMWWDAEADSDGDVVLATSSDNSTYTQVSDSTATLDKDTDVFRVIYTLHDGIFGQRLQMRTKNSWIPVSETLCRRAP